MPRDCFVMGVLKWTSAHFCNDGKFGWKLFPSQIHSTQNRIICYILGLKFSPRANNVILHETKSAANKFQGFHKHSQCQGKRNNFGSVLRLIKTKKCSFHFMTKRVRKQTIVSILICIENSKSEMIAKGIVTQNRLIIFTLIIIMIVSWFFVFNMDYYSNPIP